jgi:hypothetical protein
MTREVLLQKYKFDAVMLSDIAAYLRLGKPFKGQLNGGTDEHNGNRQLGRHEGWDLAADWVMDLHKPIEQIKQEHKRAYSEPDIRGIEK